MTDDEQLTAALAERQSREAVPMVDSDVRIARDKTKVDCYEIDPYNEHQDIVSVSATALILLAQAIRTRGEEETREFLQAFRDYAE